MTMDPDVRGIAQSFSLDPRFAAFIQALLQSEGNIVKAVQCSEDITTREQAIRVACKSVVHRMMEFIHVSGLDKAFIGYFCGKWAPIGVTNDPTNLNANLPKNLEKLWLG